MSTEIGVTDCRAVVKQINKDLNFPRNRQKGLISLQSFLDQCPDDLFIEHCVSWLQKCNLNNNSTCNEKKTSCEVLRRILTQCFHFPELTRSVSHFITTWLPDQFSKYLSDSEYGWICVKTCFILYNGACGAYQENIGKMISLLVASDKKVSATVSTCYALLPSLGGGGTNRVQYKTKWKDQYSYLITWCHAIMNELFKNLQEIQEFHIENENEDVNSERKFEELSMHLRNYLSVLQAMLLVQFPVAKSVTPDLLISLICRGLAVTTKTLGHNETSETITLRSILPEIHVSLFLTLDALITCCTRNLLPYGQLFCKLVRQSLQWTETPGTYGFEKSFSSLRVAAYTTLTNWLIVSQTGSSAESISKTFITSVLADIHLERPTVMLKGPQVMKQAKKKDNARDERVDYAANGMLCYAALKTMETFLKSVGGRLKAEEHKAMQSKIIGLLIEIGKSCEPRDVLIPYSLPKCREALYAVLLALTMEPSPKWPPPTQFAIALFSQGQRDPFLNVSMFCTTALSVIEKIIHPGFSVAAFPVSFDSVIHPENEEQPAVQLTWKETEENHSQASMGSSEPEMIEDISLHPADSAEASTSPSAIESEMIEDISHPAEFVETSTSASAIESEMIEDISHPAEFVETSTSASAIESEMIEDISHPAESTSASATEPEVFEDIVQRPAEPEQSSIDHIPDPQTNESMVSSENSSSLSETVDITDSNDNDFPMKCVDLISESSIDTVLFIKECEVSEPTEPETKRMRTTSRDGTQLETNVTENPNIHCEGMEVVNNDVPTLPDKESSSEICIITDETGRVTPVSQSSEQSHLNSPKSVNERSPSSASSNLTDASGQSSQENGDVRKRRGRTPQKTMDKKTYFLRSQHCASPTPVQNEGMSSRLSRAVLTPLKEEKNKEVKCKSVSPEEKKRDIAAPHNSDDNEDIVESFDDTLNE